jgi:hypothetical protein
MPAVLSPCEPAYSTRRAGVPVGGLRNTPWLRERYEIDRMTEQEIANLGGWNRRAVWEARVDASIPARRQSRREILGLDDGPCLRSLYVDRGRSPSEIAVLFGCSAVTIRRALALHAVSRKVARDARLDDRVWLTARYVTDDWTAEQIGTACGCSKPTALKALHRAGITVRATGRRAAV